VLSICRESESGKGRKVIGSELVDYIHHHFLLSPGNGNFGAILHDDVTTVVADNRFDVLKIDQVRFVRSKKS